MKEVYSSIRDACASDGSVWGLKTLNPGTDG